MLLSAYRRDDYADPDSFVAQLGMVLGEYPDEIVDYVTDPLTGIQRRQKFPPNLQEVVEACEGRKRHLEKQVELEQWKAKVDESNRLRLEHGRTERKLPGISYGEFLERFPERRPIGFFETPPSRSLERSQNGEG
jgi:hypothetical protein